VQLVSNRSSHRRGHSVANLPVLVINIAEELEVVSEPLGPRELPNGADPVLFRMNNLSLFAREFRGGEGGFQDPVPRDTTEGMGPAVTPFVCGVGKEPGDNSVLPVVQGVADVLRACPERFDAVAHASLRFVLAGLTVPELV